MTYQTHILQAIVTRYAGPTDHRGSRIMARTAEGIRLTMGYRHELNADENHRGAAEALRDRLGWNGDLIGGYLGHGRWAWVFADEGA